VDLGNQDKRCSSIRWKAEKTRDRQRRGDLFLEVERLTGEEETEGGLDLINKNGGT